MGLQLILVSLGRLMKLIGKNFLRPVLIGLPTQLNPVERFFEELRKYTANRVFDNKEQVEKLIASLVIEFQDQPQKIKKLTLYPYMTNSA
jgi:hypothetical protein